MDPDGENDVLIWVYLGSSVACLCGVDPSPFSLCDAAVSHPAFLMSTMAEVAKRQRVMSVAKYSRSTAVITPLEIRSKWVRKLKEAMALRRGCGAQPLKKSITGGKPLMRKPKQRTTVTTKALTWFLVKADTADPIARNPPAIRHEPM